MRAIKIEASNFLPKQCPLSMYYERSVRFCLGGAAGVTGAHCLINIKSTKAPTAHSTYNSRRSVAGSHTLGSVGSVTADKFQFSKLRRYPQCQRPAWLPCLASPKCNRALPVSCQPPLFLRSVGISTESFPPVLLLWLGCLRCKKCRT